MRTFHLLVANTLVASVTNNFLWFALTFWVYPGDPIGPGDGEQMRGQGGVWLGRSRNRPPIGCGLLEMTFVY